MSLYGLAADLFSDIDKARAAGPSIHSRDLSRGGGQSSALSKWKQMRPQPGQEGELPRLRSGGRQAEHDKRTPTLELLEGCLRDVQQIRSGTQTAVRVPIAQLIHEGHAGKDRMYTPPLGPNTPPVGKRGRVPWRLTENNEEISSPTKVDHQEPRQSSRCSRPLDSVPSFRHMDTDDYPPMRLASNYQRASTITTESTRRNDPDAAARERYAEFERQVEEWSTSTGAKASQRVREDFVAHLSTKYLCSSLDPLPSSPIVSHLRREVARRLEMIAAAGNADRVDLPARVRHRSAERMPHCTGPRVGAVDARNDRYQECGQHHYEVSYVGGRGQKRSNSESKAISQGRSRGESTETDSAVDVHVTPRDKEIIGEVGPKVSDESDGLVFVLASSATGGSGSEALRAARLPGDGGPTRSTRGLATGLGEPAKDEDSLGACHDGVGGVKPSLSSMRGSAGHSVHNKITRAKAVRFLLKDTLDENTPSVLGTTGLQLQQASKEKELGFCGTFKNTCWVCTVCDKRNGEGADTCTTCGRCRGMPRATRGALSSRGTIISGVTNEKIKELEEQEDASARSGRSGASARQAQVFSRGPERDVAKDTIRSNRGVYDFACFAKMRQTTQPAAKARLGLTHEIKSLLTAIRGGGS